MKDEKYLFTEENAEELINVRGICTDDLLNQFTAFAAEFISSITLINNPYAEEHELSHTLKFRSILRHTALLRVILDMLAVIAEKELKAVPGLFSSESESFKNIIMKDDSFDGTNLYRILDNNYD